MGAMTTAQLIDSFFLHQVVPYIQAQDFARIESVTKDSRNLMEKAAFTRCLAYGFPGLQVNILHKLLKELPRVHLVPVLTRLQRKVDQHFLEGFGYTNTFVKNLTFSKVRAGCCARMRSQTSSQSLIDCWISSAVEFEVSLSDTGLCKFHMRLLLFSDLQRIAVEVRSTCCEAAHDPVLLVDVEAFRNAVMILKMTDASVKVNGLGVQEEGMVHVKKMNEVADSLQSGLTCAMVVRERVYGYAPNSLALNALNIHLPTMSHGGS